MVSGTIVPVAITCSLLLRAMKESGNDKFLIDGFPRNQDNLDGWMKEANLDVIDVKCVLFLKCSQETCLKRCLKRGQEGSGRADDDEEILNKRFVTHTNSTLPIVEYYRKQGIVIEVNANCSEEEMYQEITSKFAF